MMINQNHVRVLTGGPIPSAFPPFCPCGCVPEDKPIQLIEKRFWTSHFG